MGSFWSCSRKPGSPSYRRVLSRRQLHGCEDQCMAPPTDPLHAGEDPHIVLGLVGDPGAAYSLARELADTELHCELDQRLPGARWCVEVMEHRLVQPPATDAQI